MRAMIDEASPSITNLPEQVAGLDADARARFADLFAVTRSGGSLQPPEEMRAWIERSFGSVEAVQAQTIIKTLNRWTLEGTLFNDLRARRPVARQAPGADADAELAGGGDDPFCHPLTGTPADTFGRIEGAHTITASNVAKYDALHAVILFKEHNPLTWSGAQVADAFATAARWIAAAAAARPEAVYPFVMWNCRPRSGASQVHGHMQATLGEGGAYGRVELWRRAAESYRARHGRDYFADFYAAHAALGLAGRHGAVRWLAHLTPVKEKELVLLAPAFDGALAAAVADLLRLLIATLGVRAFNVACYLPPLAPVAEDWTDFPVVVRMVDRGDPGSATSDIGAMELFAQPVVAFDPWKLAGAVREAFPAA
jgi:hypothetical protein